MLVAAKTKNDSGCVAVSKRVYFRSSPVMALSGNDEEGAQNSTHCTGTKPQQPRFATVCLNDYDNAKEPPMEETPSLDDDIDALFDHLVQDLGYEATEEMDWVFSFRSSDFGTLQQLGTELIEEFVVELQDEVEETDEDDQRSIGDPLLIALRRDALTRDEIKEAAARLTQLAAERGVEFEGVDCFEPIDDEQAFEWLKLEDATELLGSYTESGLEEDASLPWVFLILTPTVAEAQNGADQLNELGFPSIDVYEEQDEDGNFGLCVFVDGRNNALELTDTYSKIHSISQSIGGKIEGIQFLTRAMLNDAFDDEGETEGNDAPES